MVFIPVSDMDRAIDWYSRLFNLPAGEPSHTGTIYTVPMEGTAGLILNSTRPEVHNSSQPLCFFWTDNLKATREFLLEQDVPILNEPEDIGSVSTLIFHDPDNNLLMVCHKN